jgi:hypothetical protein
MAAYVAATFSTSNRAWPDLSSNTAATNGPGAVINWGKYGGDGLHLARYLLPRDNLLGKPTPVTVPRHFMSVIYHDHMLRII